MYMTSNRKAICTFRLHWKCDFTVGVQEIIPVFCVTPLAKSYDTQFGLVTVTFSRCRLQRLHYFDIHY